MNRLGSVEALAAVYAAVVETALDCVIVTDEAGRVVAMNPAAVATFGYTPAEATGRDIGHLIVPDHMKEAHHAGMQRYRETGEAHVLGRRVEMEARHRDGHLIPVELAITEVRIPAGRYFTANLRDLRPAHSARHEIERQRAALHQSEKLSAIGSLLAGVTHELNNPLTIAMGEVAMLLGDVDELAGVPLPMAERVRRIHDATGRCARVVRSFLARVRQRPPMRRSTDPAELVDAALDLLSHSLASTGVKVFHDLPDPAPQVLADPDQAEQIVVNLVLNAIQALELAPLPRRIDISGEIRGGQFVLAVQDSGPGIPSELAERIFEPFFSTKPEGAGTGIGLAVSRDLALAQDGTLALIQSDGGARFELALPIAAALLEADAGQVPSPSITARRVLIVDDEIGLAQVLADGLRKRRHDCVTASGGRVALELLQDRDFDAVVCDVQMPDLDGPALYRRIVAEHPHLAPVTVFMTGNVVGQLTRRLLADLGRPVLEKPFTPADLAETLETLPRSQ